MRCAIVLLIALVACRPEPRSLHSDLLRLQWRARIGNTGFRHTIAVADRTVYVACGRTYSEEIRNDAREVRHYREDDGLYAVDLTSGASRRLFRDSDLSGAAYEDGKLYFGSESGWVRCVARGEPLWSTRVDAPVKSAAALTDREVVVGTQDGRVVALDRDNGRLRWQVRTGANSYGNRGVYATPAVHDGDIFVGARDGVFYALDGRTGAKLWTYNAGSGIHASAIVTDGDVIFAESEARLHFLDVATGIERASVDLQCGLFSSPSPVGDGSVVIGTSWWRSREDILGVDEQGALWRVEVPARVSSSAVVFGGMAAIGCEDGRLLLVTTRGEVVARMQLDGAIECTPAVVERDGRVDLLVATRAGWLYCFETGARGGVVWGSFRGDTRNSGTYGQRIRTIK